MEYKIIWKNIKLANLFVESLFIQDYRFPLVQRGFTGEGGGCYVW